MKRLVLIIKKIIPTTAVLVAVVLVLLYTFIWRIPTSQEIFAAAQHSVVELKSQTSETIVTYGSAVLIDNDGTLVSNAHVVVYKEAGVYKTFETFEIRFSFEMDYRKVSLIKYDVNKDIAVLKIDDIANLKLKPINVGDNSKIVTGDRVYAVGNGMNHGVSISQGIVSLPQVNIVYEGNVRNVIQCDLIINVGNSGGALLDKHGKLIGITTFRIKDNLGNPIYGVAFCIPVNVVLDYIVFYAKPTSSTLIQELTPFKRSSRLEPL